MSTVILQSFRRHDVPEWIRHCMASVENYAASRGWTYHCMDDRFFDLAPAWVRERCHGHVYALTDVCRLQWLSDTLAQGAQRVVWVDADVIIFAPENLHIHTPRGHAFAHELYLQVEPDGRLTALEGLNNAVMAFTNHDTVLPRYLAACLDQLRTEATGPMPRTVLGPSLLRTWDRKEPLDRIQGVGLFTYGIMSELARGGGPLLDAYLQRSPSPLGAANLCHFLRNVTPLEERASFDRMYGIGVQRLGETVARSRAVRTQR